MKTNFKKGDVIRLKSSAIEYKGEESIRKLIVDRKKDYYIWRYYPIEDFKDVEFDSRYYSDTQFELWELNN
jgi:hypothetical protein